MYQFVLYILFVQFCFKVAGENDRVGPYKVIMVNTSRCDNPSLPYQKEPSVIAFIEVYNTTKKSNLMRGNITILKEKANYNIKLKCHMQENGQWKVNIVINSVGCRGVLLKLLSSLMNFPYNKEKCLIKKGTFRFSRLDANQIEHAWANTKIYGDMKCRIEATLDGHTAECWMFYQSVVPLI